jgi:MFS family permease
MPLAQCLHDFPAEQLARRPLPAGKTLRREANMTRSVVVGPRGTAWGAVLGGWLATLGVAALLSPLVNAMLGSLSLNERSLAAAAPVIVGVGLAYLIGGYIAGRMAGYRTSWHGLLAAFFGLFVVLALIVVAVALQQGVFGSTYYLPEILPPLVSVGLYHSAEALAFGGLLGMLVAIFSAWLGGLLAPTRSVAVASVNPVDPVVAPVERTDRVVTDEPERTVGTEPDVRRPVERRRFRLLPSVGRKGGERVERTERIEPE